MEENKLIAEFMGMEKQRHSDGRYLFTTDIDELKGADTRFWEQLYFHVSWDWLMPVVKKCLDVYHIEQMNDDIHFQFYDSLGDIKLTYQAVVKFINQYNDEQNKA